MPLFLSFALTGITGAFAQGGAPPPPPPPPAAAPAATAAPAASPVAPPPAASAAPVVASSPSVPPSPAVAPVATTAVTTPPPPTAAEVKELKDAWKYAPRGKNGGILPFKDWPHDVLTKGVKRLDGSVVTLGDLTGLVAVTSKVVDGQTVTLTAGVACDTGEYWSKTWGWCVSGSRADYQAQTEGRMFGELRRADAGLVKEMSSLGTIVAGHTASIATLESERISLTNEVAGIRDDLDAVKEEQKAQVRLFDSFDMRLTNSARTLRNNVSEVGKRSDDAYQLATAGIRRTDELAVHVNRGLPVTGFVNVGWVFASGGTSAVVSEDSNSVYAGQTVAFTSRNGFGLVSGIGLEGDTIGVMAEAAFTGFGSSTSSFVIGAGAVPYLRILSLDLGVYAGYQGIGDQGLLGNVGGPTSTLNGFAIGPELSYMLAPSDSVVGLDLRASARWSASNQDLIVPLPSGDTRVGGQNGFTALISVGGRFGRQRSVVFDAAPELAQAAPPAEPPSSRAPAYFEVPGE